MGACRPGMRRHYPTALLSRLFKIIESFFLGLPLRSFGNFQCMAVMSSRRVWENRRRSHLRIGSHLQNWSAEWERFEKLPLRGPERYICGRSWPKINSRQQQETAYRIKPDII